MIQPALMGNSEVLAVVCLPSGIIHRLQAPQTPCWGKAAMPQQQDQPTQQLKARRQTQHQTSRPFGQGRCSASCCTRAQSGTSNSGRDSRRRLLRLSGSRQRQPLLRLQAMGSPARLLRKLAFSTPVAPSRQQAGSLAEML